jgi:hypothetical protein
MTLAYYCGHNYCKYAMAGEECSLRVWGAICIGCHYPASLHLWENWRFIICILDCILLRACVCVSGNLQLPPIEQISLDLESSGKRLHNEWQIIVQV